MPFLFFCEKRYLLITYLGPKCCTPVAIMLCTTKSNKDATKVIWNVKPSTDTLQAAFTVSASGNIIWFGTTVVFIFWVLQNHKQAQQAMLI